MEKITKYSYPKPENAARFPRVVIDEDKRKALKGVFATGEQFL